MTYIIATAPAIVAICLLYPKVDACFYASLFATILAGVGTSLGDATILGFLKTFPGNTLSYYSSGNVFGGIVATVVFLCTRPLGIKDSAVYFLCVPAVIPYLLCFMWLNHQKKVYPYV